MKNCNDIIVKYPKIFKDYELNPSRVNWGFPKGWYDIVDIACDLIQHHVDNHNQITQVTCLQIKEKFGGLRFYCNGGDEYTNGIIRFVEVISYNICESCGSNQNIGDTQGWISTVCEKCEINYKDTWVKRN